MKKFTKCVLVCIGLLAGIAIFGCYLFLSDNPKLPTEITKVECSLFDDALHTMGPYIEITETSAIDRISDQISAGRRMIPPFQKTQVVAAIRITGKNGEQRRWTLYKDYSLGEWGPSKSYYVGGDLQIALGEAVRFANATSNTRAD